MKEQKCGTTYTLGRVISWIVSFVCIMKPSSHRLIAVLILITAIGATAFAQTAAPISSSCNTDAAVEIIEHQLAESRTFDDGEARITVVIRIADLLWQARESQARAAFVEAFELAKKHYKEKGDEPTQEGTGLMITTLDPRYTVLSSIAKRDSAWAKKLMNELIREQLGQAKEKGFDDRRNERALENMFMMANSLLATDQATAMYVATESLKFPLTPHLARFLYELTQVNRPAADQLYQAALAAYSRTSMNRFLHLSSFPFGLQQELADTFGSTYYEVPGGFQPNPSLQRLFVQALLRRAQDRLGRETPLVEGRLSESERILIALRQLEKPVTESLPELSESLVQARNNLAAQLPASAEKRMQPPERVKGSFREQVEGAEKLADVHGRDRLLAFAVIGAPETEDLDAVVKAVDKISDSGLRTQLLNWLYFNRAHSLIRQNQFFEARKLAAKVEELDQRGFLYFRITEESLKQNEDQTQAREMLEEVVTAALKSAPTLTSVRTLLGVAHLYTKIDVQRAIAVLADAVKMINRLESPDFSRQFVLRKIEGKTFWSYAAFHTPGFNPENAFRQISKSDFDGTLYQASGLSNKPLRALTTLAIIEPCLKVTKQKRSTK